MTKFSLEELIELARPDGGRFATGSVKAAKEFCREIATAHYENFPVGSMIIDKRKREHFYSVYSFARIADDISDEFHNRAELRISALDGMSQLVDESAGDISGLKNPVFIALSETMKAKAIPAETLKRLLTAFKRDIQFKQPGNFTDLEDYCFYSANPIGELVLRIFNAYNETTAPLSDKICTGLQLVNFWQDFSRDIPAGRLYIPADILSRYNLSAGDIAAGKPDNKKFRSLLEELYSETEKYFTAGSSILRYLSQLRLRTEIALTIRGGLFILEKTKSLGTGILKYRPKLKKINYLKLIILAVIDGLDFKNRTGSLRKS